MWITTKSRSRTGEQLVFQNSAPELGSSLEPVVGIYDANQNLLKAFGEDGGRDANDFAYTFAKAGTYYIRVSDYEDGGNGRHFYRIKVGHFPLAMAAFPLGLQQGKEAEIHLTAYNLNSKVASERRALPRRPARGDLPP